MQKGEQNTYRLLFIPGQYKGQWQFIHGTAEGFCQTHRHTDGAVRIVALPHVHQSWQSSDFSQRQIVKTKFTAGKCQHNGVFRRLFYKLCVIISAGLCPVAARHQKEVPDFSFSYRFHHSVRMGKNCRMGKARSNFFAAVNTCKFHGFGKAAECQRLLNNR